MSYKTWQHRFLEPYFTPEEIDYLMNKAKPWPDANSIYIGYDIIYIVTSQKELNNFRAKMKAQGYSKL